MDFALIWCCRMIRNKLIVTKQVKAFLAFYVTRRFITSLTREHHCLGLNALEWWCLVAFVRFQVLMAASMKFRVFWDVAPCSLVGVDRRFRDAYCLHQQGRYHPDDGGSTYLLKCQATPMRLHGATSQNALNFCDNFLSEKSTCY
jgi:hypothetical protein